MTATALTSLLSDVNKAGSECASRDGKSKCNDWDNFDKIGDVLITQSLTAGHSTVLTVNR